MMITTWCLLFLFLGSLGAQEKSSEWQPKRSIPRWAREEFRRQHFDRDYTVIYNLYPSYFRGDFNGDGRRDVAILVQNKENKKIGIIIIHGKEPQIIPTRYFILGAGKSFDNLGDDLKWMTVWSLIGERDIARILGNKKLPTLYGDVIKTERHNGKAGIVYWDGKKYKWQTVGK